MYYKNHDLYVRNRGIDGEETTAGIASNLDKNECRRKCVVSYVACLLVIGIKES